MVTNLQSKKGTILTLWAPPTQFRLRKNVRYHTLANQGKGSSGEVYSRETYFLPKYLHLTISYYWQKRLRSAPSDAPAPTAHDI